MNRQHLLHCSTSYMLKDTVGPLPPEWTDGIYCIVQSATRSKTQLVLSPLNEQTAFTVLFNQLHTQRHSWSSPPSNFLHGLPMKQRNTAPLGYGVQLRWPHSLYWLRFHCCLRVQQRNVWQSNLKLKGKQGQLFIKVSTTYSCLAFNNVGKVLVHNSTTCGMFCGWIKVSLHVTLAILTLLAVSLTLCSLV